MRNILLLALALLMTIFPFRPVRCEDVSSFDPEDIIREWTGDDSAAAEYFYDLLVYPVNLATADERTLRRFPVLSDRDIRRIIDFRETHVLVNLLDLTNSGLDPDLLNRVRPFTVVQPAVSNGIRLTLTTGFSRGENSEISNHVTNSSSAETGYVIRTLLRAGHWTGGFSVRDENSGWRLPAAPVLSGLTTNSKYFLRYQDKPFDLTAGFFRAEFGQGLLFGSCLQFPVQNIDREPVRIFPGGLRPNLSPAIDPDGDRDPDDFFGFGMQMNFPDAQFLRPQARLFVSERPDETVTAANGELELPVGKSALGGTVSRRTGTDEGESYSVYADFTFMDCLSFFGEYAWAEGRALKAGNILDGGWWCLSGLFYLAETNFQAPSGSPLLHRARDILGGFAALSVGSPSFRADGWADLSCRMTNSACDQRYQVRLTGSWKTGWEWIPRTSCELSSKYSILDDDSTLRSGLTLALEMYLDVLSVAAKWRNLLNFTKQEMGNLYSVRIRFSPGPLFRVTVRWSAYRAASYDSALYLSDETADPGEFSLTPYYGIGNAWDTVVKFRLSGVYSGALRYSEDNRELAYRTGSSDRSASLYVTGEL